MKFRSDLVHGLLNNEGDHVGKLFRSWDVGTPITLSQGYGVAEAVPLRILAYAVPLLRLARQLPPTAEVEFYWALSGSLRANPVSDMGDMDAREKVAWSAASLLKKYVERFHDGLGVSNRTDYQMDLPSAIGLPEDYERGVIEWLLSQAREVVRDDPSIASFLKKRGGDRALRYMAEHALYMRDPIEFEDGPLPGLLGMPIFFPHRGATEEEAERGYRLKPLPYGRRLVMVGGPSEKIFWKFRQKLIQRIGCVHDQWKSYQFFTGVGKISPYYPQPGEICVNYSDPENCNLKIDLQTVLAQDRPLVRDWLVLLQDAAGVDRFAITLATMKGSEETRVLQKGLDRLLDWIRSLPSG